MADGGISRRSMGLMLGAGALGACAQTPAPAGWSAPLAPRGTPLRLAPVHVEAERMIRVIAGLRPYRPQGFVVRSERLGDKLVTHNYGHGGGGVTLSWGSSELAVREGFDSAVADYAVLGAGAMGLSTARLLQERGGRVTIYARELPPHTTSNIAGAQWWPTSVYRRADAPPGFEEQFAAAARIAYRRFQTLVGDHYGVRWTRNYQVGDEAPSANWPTPPDGPLAGLAPEVRDLAPDEHPFDYPYVRQFTSMMVEPSVYLQAVMEDFLTAGGRIVVRDFPDRAAIAALPESRVFNCTGLGARALFGDEDLIPARGQLVFLLPQPEVTYNLLGPGYAYMFPRADGVLLGGTFERGQWDTTPDDGITARILADHRAIFDRLRV